MMHWLHDNGKWIYYLGILIYILIAFVEFKRRKLMRETHEQVTNIMMGHINSLLEGIRVRDQRIRQLEAELVQKPPLPPAFNPVFQQSEVLREILEEGRRGLAKKYHPDKPGGDARKMQQINTVVARMVQGR